MLLTLLQSVLLVLSMLILARALVSWFYPRQDVEWVYLLYRVTDYVLAPIRSVVPPAGGLDFSPWIALILITIVLSVLT